MNKCKIMASFSAQKISEFRRMETFIVMGLSTEEAAMLLDIHPQQYLHWLEVRHAAIETASDDMRCHRKPSRFWLGVRKLIGLR